MQNWFIPFLIGNIEPLKNSIKETNGNVVPIVVNRDGVVLDGHHRVRDCIDLNLKPKYKVMEFSSKSEERRFVYEINLKRRHLNKFQKAELGYNLQKEESKNAKLRRLSTLKKGNIPVITPLVSFEANGELLVKGKVSTIIAEKIGITKSDYERSKKIIEHGTETQKQRLRAGRFQHFKGI